MGWGSTLETQQWSRCPSTCSMVGPTGFLCAAVDSATTTGLHRELAIPEVPTALHACIQLGAADPKQTTVHSCSVSVAHDTLPTPRRCSSFIRQSNPDDGAADGASRGNRLLQSDHLCTHQSQAHRRQREPRRMLCARRAPAPDTPLLSSRVLTTARRCTEREAARRSIACRCTANARSPAAQRPPALARTLTALGAAAVFSFSVAGACHANELFQKTCAGARL